MNAQVRFEPKHQQHRRNARLCALLARDAATSLDRWTLLTMQESWLALAENEEWLAGQTGADTHSRATFGPPLSTPAAPQTVFWGS
jgi:hypothetical protein